MISIEFDNERFLKYLVEEYKRTEIDKIYDSAGSYINNPFPHTDKEGPGPIGKDTYQTYIALKTGISDGNVTIIEEVSGDKFVYGIYLKDDSERNVSLGFNDEWLGEVLYKYLTTFPLVRLS